MTTPAGTDPRPPLWRNELGPIFPSPLRSLDPNFTRTKNPCNNPTRIQMAKTEDLIEGTHYEVGGSVITDYDNEHFNDATLPWKFNDDGSLRGGYDDESPYVYLGEHGPDRYGFFLVLQDSTTKVAKIHCGCRQFTYAQAMRHWKGGITAVHNDPAWPGVQRPHHLALVKCAREIAKINGWKF